MSPDALSPVALFELVLLLMALVVPLELLARRLRLPPAAALILAGMALAFVPGRHEVHLDPDLMLVLFLPPLLMSGAYFTVWRDFRANLGLIATLAVGAVAFTTLVVGVVVHWVLPSLPWAACFALGAIVSPPDAVAAKAVLARVTLPARMVVLLEGESLVNDASGLVLFRFAVAAALTGGFSLGGALLSFGVLSVGGVAVGMAFGWAATLLLPRLREVHLTVVGSLLVSWASYIAADRLGTSGVLSTVACGLVLGWNQHEVLTAQTRTQARVVWGVVEFVLESLIFVLIGLSLRGVLQALSGSVLPLLPAMAAVVAAVVLSRFAWLFATSWGTHAALRTWGERPSAAALSIMGWAGMRGVVSLAIALALPEAMPGRDVILLTTFVVILVTVLVQGSTLEPLIHLLRLRGKVEAAPATLGEVEARVLMTRAQFEVVRARAHDADGALRHPRLLEQYEYRARVMERVREARGALTGERTAHFDLVVAAVAAGRTEVLRLHRAGRIHDAVLRTLEAELDLEELGAMGRRGPGLE